MSGRESFAPLGGDGEMDCPFCEVSVGYSDEDPDSAFSDLLNHIKRWHPDEDQSPAVLWPKVVVREFQGGGAS